MIDALASALANSPTPDLLRLVAVPVFGWAAYRDIRTRRVPNRTWLPLAALGIALLVWEIAQLSTGGSLHGIATVQDRELFYLRVALSLGMVGSIGYIFYWIGGFGGADAKALIVLAVLFPAFPHYLLPAAEFPLHESAIGVFSLTILTNTVLVGVLYPVGVSVANALRGHLTPVMFVGKPVRAADVTAAYGSLLQTPAGFTRRGLDLDALRMYLRWRGCTLADVRDDPETYRDPANLPANPNPPGDGAIPPGDDESTDESTAGDPAAADDAVAGDDAATAESETVADGGSGNGSGGELVPLDDDPWGAQTFLDDIEGGAYGTTADDLRDGLDVLVAEETVWISPGLPFIVPMFLGLLVSIVYGDVFAQFVSGIA